MATNFGIRNRLNGNLPKILAGVFFLAIAGCGDGRETGTAGSPGVTRPANVPLLNEVLVEVRPGVDASGLWNDYHVTVDPVLPDGSTYRVTFGSGTTQQMIQLLSSDDRVTAAEENLPVRTPVMKQTSIAFNEGFFSTGDFFSGSPLSRRLHLAMAHTGSKGLGVKVAILDTGTNAHHKVLEGRISPDSWDFVDNDSNPADLPDGIDNDMDGVVDEATGHGSHVSGLVAMVAPSSKIMALRVLNSDGQGTAFTVAQAIEYAVNHGARIINLSLSLSSTSAAIDRAFEYARAHDTILVTAAGNSGYIEYPAADARVWAVGALATSGEPASFSSSFPGVVLSAPGENILSASWNEGFSTWSGTSMAAPIVAASAALVLARDPSLSSARVLQRLQETSSQIPGNPVGMGSGAVDPGAAVGLKPTVTYPRYESIRRDR